MDDDVGTEELPRPDFAPAPARRIHHLNCGTFCPLGRSFLNEHGKLVCHCLLIETEQGLVLVDTGLGTDAVQFPPKGTSRFFQTVLVPQNRVEETAARQIEALGHSIDDVRHIVLTHLDVDHAGGLPDFPRAKVHVFEDELLAARAPSSLMEQQRYNGSLWSHDVQWQVHALRGERWYGFPCVRDLPGLPPEILLVPLQGHTRGHCGVAVDVGGRWILHCGDAYFFKDEMDLTNPWCTPGLKAFQRVVAVDDKVRRRNQERLRELARGVAEGISLFSSHDPDDLERMKAEDTLPAHVGLPSSTPV